MTAVVTDAMVGRALDVLSRWDADEVMWPECVRTQIAREVIQAALTDPRMCKGCAASLADMRIDAEWCSRACKIRTDRRVAAEKAAQTTDPAPPLPPRRPGGLQVAFGPAVNHVSKYLSDATPLNARDARQVAERVLTHALSVKQRQRRKHAQADRWRDLW